MNRYKVILAMRSTALPHVDTLATYRVLARSCLAWFMGERCVLPMQMHGAGSHADEFGNRWNVYCRDCRQHPPGQCPEGWPEGAR